MHKLSTIYIIGFRGCGKTTIGYILSKKLKYKFKDTDELIQKNYNTTISNLVNTEGWEKFRKIESEILRNTAEKNTIVSTGGGIILNKNNITFMRKKGVVFYLFATVEILKMRLLKDFKKNLDQRPNLTNYKSIDDEIDQVLKNRLNVYKKTAHFTINANQSPKKIVQQILKNLSKKNSY